MPDRPNSGSDGSCQNRTGSGRSPAPSGWRSGGASSEPLEGATPQAIDAKDSGGQPDTEYEACFSWIMTITHEKRDRGGGANVLVAQGLATDFDAEHGGTDANKRDGARQVGGLNVPGLQL
jgi:hypothetical protein